MGQGPLESLFKLRKRHSNNRVYYTPITDNISYYGRLLLLCGSRLLSFLSLHYFPFHFSVTVSLSSLMAASERKRNWLGQYEEVVDEGERKYFVAERLSWVLELLVAINTFLLYWLGVGFWKVSPKTFNVLERFPFDFDASCRFSFLDLLFIHRS
jgi:hypothetical protein